MTSEDQGLRELRAENVAEYARGTTGLDDRIRAVTGKTLEGLYNSPDPIHQLILYRRHYLLCRMEHMATEEGVGAHLERGAYEATRVFLSQLLDVVEGVEIGAW